MVVIRPFHTTCVLFLQGAKDQLTSVALSSCCCSLWGECVHHNLVGLRTCDGTSARYSNKLSWSYGVVTEALRYSKCNGLEKIQVLI